MRQLECIVTDTLICYARVVTTTDAALEIVIGLDFDRNLIGLRVRSEFELDPVGLRVRPDYDRNPTGTDGVELAPIMVTMRVHLVRINGRLGYHLRI